MNNATFEMFNLPRPHILNTTKQDLIVDAQTLSAPVRLPESKQKSSQTPISEKISTSSTSISSSKPICGTTAISKLDIIATKFYVFYNPYTSISVVLIQSTQQQPF